VWTPKKTEYKTFLKTFQTGVLLEIFSSVFAYSGILLHILQTKECLEYCAKGIRIF
jgi:hypothetical protein